MFLNHLKVILICVSITASVLGWGDQGHKLINRHAMNNLPKEMELFKAWTDSVSENAPQPDKRRSWDSTEYPKHFIDLDFYDEFKDYKIVKSKSVLIEKYGDSLVTAMGILPWNTLDFYNQLVDAFKNKDRSKAISLMAYLGHYIADAHNPMHTILNYDGILTNQKGLHSRYESRMFNRFYKKIKYGLKPVLPTQINCIEKYVWDYILASHNYNQLIFMSDIEAASVDSSYGEKYYSIMWFRLQHFTTQTLNNAVESIVSIYYSAWINAGKPEFSEFN